MSTIVLLVLGAYAAFGVRQFVRLVNNTPVRADWRETAEALGLQLCSEARTSEPAMRGRIGGFKVVVTSSPRRVPDDERRWTQVVVHARRRPPQGVTAVTGDASHVRRSLGHAVGAVHATGDAAFDAQVMVMGPAPSVFALLGEEERGIVMRHVSQGGALRCSIALGAVTTEIDAAKRTPELLAAVVRQSVETARALEGDGASAKARLMRHAKTDRVPRVRAGCLLALAQERYASSAQRRAAFNAALADAHPLVRLTAATLLGTEARSVVYAIALDASVPETVRCRALDELAAARAIRDMPPDLLDRLLAEESVNVRHAAIAAAASARWAGAFDALARHAAAAPEEDHALLAEALAGFAEPRTEPALITLLGSNSRDARYAAATVLIEIGTVAAVPALLELATPVLGGEVRAAARRALRAIRARLGPAEAGWLDLAAIDEASGALSEAQEGGNLSKSD